MLTRKFVLTTGNLMSHKSKDFKQVGYEMGTKARLGRPLKHQEVMDESVTFRLSEREKQVLKDYCWRYDMSPSDVVRDALRVLGVVPSW
jgi:hypothetical protein